MVNALRDKAFAESASCLAMTNLRKERFVPRDDEPKEILLRSAR